VPEPQALQKIVRWGLLDAPTLPGAPLSQAPA
jgi:hypothetical protein